jgi:hypothetical protein
VQLSEAGILMALRWLARHQSDNGAWHPERFSNKCYDSSCAGKGKRQYEVGLTGLALLTFLCSGYTSDSPMTYDGICFGKVVQKAERFLLRSQGPNGFFGDENVSHAIYNHSIATLALAKAILLEKKPDRLKEAVQKAVRYLTEHRYGKAWGYPRGDSKQANVSATVWAVLALATAGNAGLQVPQEVLAQAAEFVDSVTEQEYLRVGYFSPQHARHRAMPTYPGMGRPVYHYSMTSAGIIIRLIAGRDVKTATISEAVKGIVSDLPVWKTRKHAIDFYHWFMGTLALRAYVRQKGKLAETHWKSWCQALEKTLVANQSLTKINCGRGSWDIMDPWSQIGGRIYATAINCLTYQLFKHQQPHLLWQQKK